MVSGPLGSLEIIVSERTDPMGIAAVWQHAADKVAALTRDDLPGPEGESWNAAIADATRLLTKEADDIRAMNEMAHRLIVGNLR